MLCIFITYLVQINAFLHDQYDRSKLSIFSHPGNIIRYWITTRSFPYTPQLHADFASVNQLHDRTLLIDKTHRRKIPASLRHMSQRNGLLWH
jgi:hypothetical protein